MKEEITDNPSSTQSNFEQTLWMPNFKSNILMIIKMLAFLSIGFVIWLIAAVLAVKFFIAT
ncbi:hypothetical protein ABFP31_07180 [Acinetobacter nosocomialis]|uniref:hypothetical protein n=1 Tax=Acinetobacter TaxID=469 RepID=UPI0025A9B656|nr:MULTISPECIES: hypothetical protein [Acinetobacter]MDM9637672.1 hypothetical protein [Acinetobacter nosocomialis]MDS7966549.1 hypothetical protein [Acinetobacter sp. V117_2]